LIQTSVLYVPHRDPPAQLSYLALYRPMSPILTSDHYVPQLLPPSLRLRPYHDPPT
jgi:hypothetical protein